ncbi:NfeD family protein [Desulfothermobacter acidiphilus]|uniref:NfeD family protein n=1 Tax=Desulfothermobacter acidiphilus TaxID=1938353 RepID=UPI003F8C541B
MYRWCWLFLLPLLLLLPGGAGRAADPKVVILTVDGPIMPVTVHYLDRGIELAERQGAAACLIRLNTPGGLYSATQKIVAREVNARVPVIVYVTPAGGWAASAGAFITMGANVAAMAPGTRIGAAHPVAGGGQEQDEIAMKKVTADAAAWMRSLAQMRSRNAALAEAMVTESRSFSADEALREHLIDVVAPDQAALLQQLDGKEVTLAGGQKVILSLSHATCEEVPLSRSEEVLSSILTPDIAYLLLTIGMIGLLVEIYHPGLIIPGVVGGIALLVALYSLGTLDAYWGGLLLLLLSFGFFVAEVFAPTHGILATGGVIGFVLGSLMLFSIRPQGVGVSAGLITAMSVTLAALMAILVTAVVRGQKRKVQTGEEELIGKLAEVRTPLAPSGMVFLEGELWQAELEAGEARVGEKVLVVGKEGLKLKVTRR